MAHFEATRSAPLGSITTYHVMNSVGGFFAAMKTWNDARITRKALASLTDRELDDIGLARSDIDRIG
jgi:uncharacterized protein YjiS (DUF1127 family)